MAIINVIFIMHFQCMYTLYILLLYVYVYMEGDRIIKVPRIKTIC